MIIHVRYFAVVRERLGRDDEELELPVGATVTSALDALAARHEAIARSRAILRVAANQVFVDGGHILNDGDELALIPPVAGGMERGRLARIVGDRAPSVDAVTSAVRAPGVGGVVTFVGLVRDHSLYQGATPLVGGTPTSLPVRRSVERLEYEAYPEMAEKVFREICEEIEAALPGVRLAVEHRTGALVVGDVAVAIAAAAPHRKEAFAACQRMIDTLKERAPIWKKEIGPDGASWVGMGP